jgi:hypothetical protein
MESSTLVLFGLCFIGYLLLPVLVNLIKDHFTAIIFAACLYMALSTVAPHSAQARIVLNQVNQVPQALGYVLVVAQDGQQEFENAYMRSF